MAAANCCSFCSIRSGLNVSPEPIDERVCTIASAEAVLAQIERIATERDVDARVWSDGDLSLTRAAQAYFDGHREAMQAELAL